MDDLARLRLDAAAAFELTPAGRIGRARGHPPGPWPTSPAGDDGPGPRFFFSGCRQGNLAFCGEALSDDLAARIEALVAGEPPWFDADIPPRALGPIMDLLSQAAAAELAGPEVVFHLPPGLAFDDHPAQIVRCDTAEGRALAARLVSDGLPLALTDAGFLAVDDLWWPWCAVLEDGRIAALAFATRLTAASAEIGVYAFPQHRRRGCATAATATWSSLAALADRTLIYATGAANQSSRHVAARLGLAAIGARLWIY
jgi:hypothetical protein